MDAASILTRGTGIFIDRPGNSASTDNGIHIYNNKISRRQTTKTGLTFVDIRGSIAAQDVARVNKNNISLSVSSIVHSGIITPYTGIRASGLGDNYIIGGPVVEADRNTISYAITSTTIQGNETSSGIWVQDLTGKNHFIRNNKIDADLSGSNSFMRSGIRLTQCTRNVLVCNNLIERTHANIRCQGDLSSTHLKSNILGVAGYGLLCDSTAVMPDQTRYQNRWTAPAYGTLGALYALPAGKPLRFRILYDANDPQTAPANMSWSPADWFKEEAGPTDGGCTINVQPFLSNREAQVISSATLSAYNAGEWDARRDLLLRMNEEPEIAAQDGAAASFQQQQSENNTSAWQFAQALHRYNRTTRLPAAHSANLKAYQARLDSISAQWQDTTSAPVAGLAQKWTEVAVERTLYYDSLVWPVHRAALEDLLPLIAALPAGQIYEANLKHILYCAVHYALHDSVATADLPLLRSIADQCPATGGNWVRLAKQWLPYQEYLIRLEKDEIAPCGATDRRESDTHLSFRDVRVIPNPAKEMVEVYLPSALTGKWQLCDVGGNVVASGSLTEGNRASIQLNQHLQGIYFFQFRSEAGGTCHHARIIVER